jgi:hypothetical protein
MVEPIIDTITAFCCTSDINFESTTRFLEYKKINSPALGSIRWQTLEVLDRRRYNSLEGLEHTGSEDQ